MLLRMNNIFFNYLDQIINIPDVFLSLFEWCSKCANQAKDMAKKVHQKL